MSKNKISSLVVAAILALVLVPPVFAGRENNDGNIQLPSQKDEAAAIIDKLASLTTPKLPRPLLGSGDLVSRECRRNMATCNSLGDNCCSGCFCVPVSASVSFCYGACA